MNRRDTKEALEALIRAAGVYETGEIALAAPEVQALVSRLANELGDERRRVADLAHGMASKRYPKDGAPSDAWMRRVAEDCAADAFNAVRAIDAAVALRFEDEGYAEAEVQRPKLLQELEKARQEAFAAKQELESERTRRITAEKHYNQIMLVRGDELRKGEFLHDYGEVGKP